MNFGVRDIDNKEIPSMESAQPNSNINSNDTTLSLNQTLLTFLLCVRQNWMTQLILAISL